MKKSMLVILCIVSTTYAARFHFIDQKQDGVLADSFLRSLVTTFKPKIFFETGTYVGNTALQAARFIDQVHTVELHEDLFHEATERLKPYQDIHVYHGKSPDVIAQVVPQLKGTILFWLDAHYSGPGTALTLGNEEQAESITPIRAELAAIKESGCADCVILIDDMRGFGTKINGELYWGCWAYPSIQEVRDMLLAINANFSLFLLGDILLAFDSTRYKATFSGTIKACTDTRLYDGANLSDRQLKAREKKIMDASFHEKAYIAELYKNMRIYPDPMFWHAMWHGLASLGNHDYPEAYDAFCHVTSGPKPYAHKRVERYKAVCRSK